MMTVMILELLASLICTFFFFSHHPHRRGILGTKKLLKNFASFVLSHSLNSSSSSSSRTNNGEMIITSCSFVLYS